MRDSRDNAEYPGDEGRPSPDALLAKVEAEEPTPGAGRLKIFFGYSAGVGKTYAMLAAARALEMKRGDVLAGYVEPHGRPETESLLLGMEILPFKEVSYRGITLREFDLDEALRRRPKLLLVDELAHTNAEGCRHAKRWQDIVELLDAGIDVYTTLNVQHLESLNDIIGKITGIVVRETVPDSVFDRASEVELVDLPPVELLERFQEGKVYLPAQASRAAERFFKKETLFALRELALRKTAEHVNRQVELGRRGLPSRPIWATRDRLMVAVGPSPTSARLIRSTRRMATDLRAPWYAVAVERGEARPLARKARGELDANLRLAESLGAEVSVLHGDDIASALVGFAHDRGVTRLVIGKSASPRWKQALRESVVDRIIRRSGDLEVLVIRGEPETGDGSRTGIVVGPWRSEKRIGDAAVVVACLSASVALALALWRAGLSEPNIIMVLLLGVVVVAFTAGRLASAVSAVLAVLAFNFFFTQPLHTFAVHNLEYIVTFGVMLAVGLVISSLVGRVRAQARSAANRADANEALHRVSQRLASTVGTAQTGAELLAALEDRAGATGAVFLAEATGLGPGIGDPAIVGDANERAVATWVFEHGSEAGAGTGTLPDAAAWHIPLSPREGERLGVLVVHDPARGRDLSFRRLVQSIATVGAHAVERELLAERARRASVEAESERLRSDILATVSHDLRTPLATIGGAVSAVLSSGRSTLSADDRALLDDAGAEAERIARLIDNLLQLGRLDDGRAAIKAEWYPVDEIIGGAIRAVARYTDTERVSVLLPERTVLVFADATLLTQLLVNLLDNALRYAPEGAVEVHCEQGADGTRLEVADRGPGLGADPARLFARFERGGVAKSSRGVGLGLTICRAVAEAHGGRIDGRNRDAGGSLFSVWLPFPAGGPPAPIDETEGAEKGVPA